MVKTAVETHFDVTLTANVLRDIIAELLLQHGRADGTRWRNIVPELSSGLYRIWWGGSAQRAPLYEASPIGGGCDLWHEAALELVAWRLRGRSLRCFKERYRIPDSAWPSLQWQACRLLGGSAASISDAFARNPTPDTDISTGAPFSWTEVVGDLQISGTNERVTNVSSDTNSTARAESALDSENHYAQVNINAPNANASDRGGANIEYAAAATTYYLGDANIGGDQDRIFKRVTGSYTELASQVFNYLAATTYTIQCRKDGSTISMRRDGVQQLSITNSDITGNTRTGFDLAGGNANDAWVDSFEAADLAAAASSVGHLTLLGVGN